MRINEHAAKRAAREWLVRTNEALSDLCFREQAYGEDHTEAIADLQVHATRLRHAVKTGRLPETS